MQKVSKSASEDLLSKVRALEKDLYYYKKTSRDLRKKLQAMSLSGSPEIEISERIQVSKEHDGNAPELEGGGKSERKKKKKGPIGVPETVSLDTLNVAGRKDGDSKEQLSKSLMEEDGSRRVDNGAEMGVVSVTNMASTAGRQQKQQIVKKRKHELRQLRCVHITSSETVCTKDNPSTSEIRIVPYKGQ